VKTAIADIPFALSTLKKSYEVLAGGKLYLSFIVLTPVAQ
jgi:hypothetical protein